MNADTEQTGFWLMSFLSDQLFGGRKIRVQSMVNNFTRLPPRLDVRTSYRGTDLVETLHRIAAVRGRSTRIRLDDGADFISKDSDLLTCSPFSGR